jgi:SRSO17 transposase
MTGCNTLDKEPVMTGEQIASLRPALAAHLQRFRHCFKRQPTFEHLERYLCGLMSDVDRKSVEPMALSAGVAPRTLQEFLSHLSWDEARAEAALQRLAADRVVRGRSIAVIDASGYFKRGDKTPGVQRQWCGERGKKDNCVIGQHLLWADDDPANPMACVICSDLYLPQSWAEDPPRRREAHIPEALSYRPKWRIAVEQLERARGQGVALDWVTFDEDYGNVPQFWFELDRLGLRGMGEVKSNFRCWPTYPSCTSLRAEHASHQVQNVWRLSPVFREQAWQRVRIKDVTRGPMAWEVKAARVWLVDRDEPQRRSRPTDRRYWLIVARQPASGEIKFFVSNAPASAELLELMRVGFSRWHIEKWFERAKQEVGLGAFEVRTYRSLMRHWLCCAMAMWFLAEQTTRLRGEKSTHHAGAGEPGDEGAGAQDPQRMVALMA